MKTFSRVAQLMAVAFALTYGSAALAAAKALIEMSGGKPSAGLAKSWKKVKNGEYEFELDTTQEVKKGTKVSPALVKSSLEPKLGTTYGVKVTEKGANKVSITYTTDEAKFLEQISKTKIRGGGDAELALESSVSEGGIRASKTDRPANADEVKAIVLKADKGVITAKVVDTKSSKITNGATIKVKAAGAVKPKDNIFFIPEKEDAGAWVPKAGSFQGGK